MTHSSATQTTTTRTDTWKAAMLILQHPSLNGRFEKFCNHKTEKINSSILNFPWTTQDRVLISIALSLATPRKPVALKDAIGYLDNEMSAVVANALAVAFGETQAALF